MFGQAAPIGVQLAASWGAHAPGQEPAITPRASARPQGVSCTEPEAEEASWVDRRRAWRTTLTKRSRRGLKAAPGEPGNYLRQTYRIVVRGAPPYGPRAFQIAETALFQSGRRDGCTAADGPYDPSGVSQSGGGLSAGGLAKNLTTLGL